MAAGRLIESRALRLSPHAQAAHDVPQDLLHRGFEILHVDDRDSRGLCPLEEIFLDSEDLLEISHVAVR